MKRSYEFFWNAHNAAVGSNPKADTCRYSAARTIGQKLEKIRGGTRRFFLSDDKHRNVTQFQNAPLFS